MSGPYSEKFNVLEVFEQNPYQKIMMGAKIDQPDDVVVINVFTKGGRVGAAFKQALETTLDNLIHLEDNENELVVVTEYKEGTSLAHYLESFSSTPEDRANLAYDYLNKVKRYEAFDPYFTSIFVDDNQVIVQNGELLLNELIIVDKQIETDLAPENVVVKIGNAIQMLLTHGVKQVDELTDRKVKAFVGDLHNNPHGYGSISAIDEAFKQAFIYDHGNDDSSDSGAAIAGAALGGAAGAGLAGAALGDSDVPDPVEPSETPETIDLSDSEPTDSVGEPPAMEPPAPEVEAPAVETNTDKSVELDGLEVVDELFSELDQEDEKPKRNVALIVMLGAIAAIAAFLIFFNPFATEERKPPTADFEYSRDGNIYTFVNRSVAFGQGNEIAASEWELFKDINGTKTSVYTDKQTHFNITLKNEGNYVISLRVKDKYDQWSETAERSFSFASEDITDIEKETDGTDTATPSEKLDKYTYTTSENGSEDTSIYRSGSKSIMLDLREGDGTGSITMKDVFIDNSTILSLWMLSDSTEPVTVTFNGYNGDTLVFSREVKHVPRAANIWEMVETKVDSKVVDKLVIQFKSPGSVLHIDDIEISSFK